MTTVSDGLYQYGGVPVSSGPQIPTTTGNTFFVDSATGSNGNAGRRPSQPLATLEAAINKCAADKGDVIVIMPGHAENIASATALNFDVAGISIVGLGKGTKRPTFTFTTANTATIPVTADNISINNCRFVGNFLSIAATFTVAAAAYFTVENCSFTDTSAVLGFLSAIKTTVSVNSDFLTVRNCYIKSDATTKSTAPIVILNTMTGLTLQDNLVVQTVAQNNVSQFVSHAALVMTAALIEENKIFSVNTDTATGAALLTTSANTGSGIIRDNVVRALDTAAAIMVTATAVQYGLFNNLYIGDGTSVSGFVLPAIGSDA